MIPSNPVPQVCNYGTSATYRDLPSEEQLRNGVVPLDSLPAAWWNCMWNMTNGAINCARYAAGVLIDEINTVLTRAGVCVNCGCVDQLYQAIDKIRQTIGTAAVAGAVKSSSTASEVAIDPTTGIMSVNCLGNAASLTTTAATVVGAINELKSTYDTCWSNNTTALNGKAPNNHASSATTYGVGSATNYGHLKISDVYNCSSCQGTDIAASQKAVYCAWKVASDAAAGNISLSNTIACALGTASAGTATTAARSDHVHPIPTCVLDKYNANQYIGIGYSCPGLAADQVAHLAAFSNNYATGCVVIKDAPKAVIQSWLGLGSAAYCAATAFRASTWWPNSLTNGCVYCAATASYATCTSCFYYHSGSSLCGPVEFGTAARCSDTSFLAATGCAADSAALGGTAASSYALKTGCVAQAGCAESVYFTYVKGKWCCLCNPGYGTFCMRMYVCAADAGTQIVFPGNCFTYMPKGADSCARVSVPAMCVNITAANINKWVAIGPTYVICCIDCVSPACTTTQNMVAIPIY